MTKQAFYQNFNRNTPVIQSFASQLTKDFDTARLLYLETAHLAMKYRKQIQEDNFEQWLKETMKGSFYKLTKQSA